MSKYGWESEPDLPVSEPIGEAGIAKTTAEDSPAVAVKVDLDEIIDLPKEAINREMVVLKEKESIGEEIAQIEESNEHLRSLFDTVFKTRMVSKETRNYLGELYPELGLESANEFTSFPSSHLANETEVVMRNQLCTITSKLGKNHFDAITKLFFGVVYRAELKEEDIKDLTGSLVRYFNEKHPQRQQALVKLKATLIELAQSIQKEKAASEVDLADAEADEEVKLAVETHLADISQYIGDNELKSALSFLLTQYSNDTLPLLNRYQEEKGLASPPVIAQDYVTDRAIINRLETLDKAKYTRFTEALDNVNQSIVDLFNALVDEDNVVSDELIERTEVLKEAYLESIKGSIGAIEHSAIYLPNESEIETAELFSRSIDIGLDELHEEYTKDTLIVGDLVISYMKYRDFYSSVLSVHVDEYVANVGTEPLAVPQQAAIHYLNDTVVEMVNVLGEAVLHDVQVYVASRNYYQALISNYYLIGELLSAIGSIHYRNKGMVSHETNQAKDKLVEVLKDYLEAFKIDYI